MSDRILKSSSLSKFLNQRPTLRSHIWQTAANWVQQAAGLVLGVLLARLLRPEDYGQYGFAAATVGLAVLPAAWTLSPQVLADGAKDPAVISDALRFADTVVLAKLALGSAACVYLWSHGGLVSFVLGLAALFPILAGDYIAVLRAALESRGNFKGNFYDSVLMVSSTAAAAIPLAAMGWGVWALAVPGIPMALLQLALFQKMTGLGWRPALPSSGRRYLKQGFLIWLAGSSEQAFLRWDKHFVGRLAGDAELGNYNRAFNYTPLSARVLNSFLANPTVSALARCSNVQGKRAILIKSGFVLLLAGVVNFAVFWWFSDLLVPWLFGTQWAEAVPVFQAFAPFSLCASFAYLPVTLLLAFKVYRTLAAARVFTLAIFAGICLMSGQSIDAVRMAWLLQGALVLQGVIFWARCMPFLKEKPGVAL